MQTSPPPPTTHTHGSCIYILYSQDGATLTEESSSSVRPAPKPGGKKTRPPSQMSPVKAAGREPGRWGRGGPF